MKPAPFLAILLLLCATTAVSAQAQTVVNPRTVEFDPSADHNAVTTDSQPVVQRYDLQIFRLSVTTPYVTANLGKPSPQTDGKIRVDFSTLVTPWPLADGTYDARVVAVGPTGTAASDASNSFTFQSVSQTCTYTLTSATQSFVAGGGAGSVSVVTGTGCTWTAASDSTWVVLGSGSTAGSGAGAVNFTVASNTGATARAATLTIGGKTLLISQAAGCSFAVSPTSLSFTEVGGPGTVTVSTASGCTWTSAGSPSSWLNFSTSSGSGPGAATFTVAENTGATTRNTSLTIAGKTVSVTQTAPAPCTYSISPTGRSFTQGAGSVTVAVTAGAGCSWTASSPVTWATVAGGSGSGNGSVTVNVGANDTTSTRSSTLTIAGKTFSVTQDGLACTYTISPSSYSFPSDGGTLSVAVTALNGCSWSASSPVAWTSVTGSGTSNGNVSVNVVANDTTAIRSTTLTIAGKPFAVTEDGIACTYSVSPATSSFPAVGGTGSFTLISSGGCPWTATSSAPDWLTLATAAGSGGATIGFNVGANAVASPRTATITVGNQSLTVTQAAAVVCAYGLSSTGQNFASGAGAGSVDVTATAGCGWTAASSAAWVTLTGGGSGNGNGTVSFSVAANPTTSARSATLTAAGRPYTVTQDALSCTFTLDPATQSFPATAASGSVTVKGPGTCGWTATNVPSWVTLGATNGNGGASVPITVAANPSATQRTASLAIAGLPLTVTQAAGSCSYTLSPTVSSQFGPGGGNGTFSVSCGSGCTWAASLASSNVTWVTLTTTSGSGAGTVSYTVAKNTTATARSATIAVNGQSYTVKQSAANGPSKPKKPRVTIGG